MAVGPNVRRLGYLDVLGQIRIHFSEQADGQWLCRAILRRAEEERATGATDEEAAAAMVTLLEARGEYLPPPPETFWQDV